MTTALIIDDDERVCDSIKRCLERTGHYDVRAATGGEQGLELARAIVPDVIILDLMMPRMTGADVAARLRAEPATAKVPIIYLTGLVDKGELRTLGGFIDGERYLAKPADVEELHGAIREALEQAAQG